MYVSGIDSEDNISTPQQRKRSNSVIAISSFKYVIDPTKDILCVPIFHEMTRDLVGVLHAQRPSIRAHFRRAKSRQGGRRGRSRSPQKKINEENIDEEKRLQMKKELTAKNRARKAPYQLISEEAFIQLIIIFLLLRILF